MNLFVYDNVQKKSIPLKKIDEDMIYYVAPEIL